MPAVEEREWTVADVRRLRDEHEARAEREPIGYARYEVVDGELFVGPAPSVRHQRVSYLLQRQLDDFVFPRGLGFALAAPADVNFDEHTGVQPDLTVSRLMDGRLPTRLDDDRLLLLVEIISPSTARADRVAKRARYQRAGIEYWIVDVDSRLVERWRPEDQRPEIVTATLAWQPRGAAEPLAIDVQALFAALGDEVEDDGR